MTPLSPAPPASGCPIARALCDLLSVRHDDLLAVGDRAGQVHTREHGGAGRSPGRLYGLGDAGAGLQLDHARAHHLAHHVDVQRRSANAARGGIAVRGAARTRGPGAPIGGGPVDARARRSPVARTRVEHRTGTARPQRHDCDGDQHGDDQHRGAGEHGHGDRSAEAPSRRDRIVLLECGRRPVRSHRSGSFPPQSALQDRL
nr:hypothetical protein [Leucobacter muris]